MKSIKNYLLDESAIDESVTKILFVLLGVVVVMAIGWFGWNLIAEKADSASEASDSTTNPGSGSEFSSNPFGN